MRRAYKSFTTIQDSVLAEAEKKPMSKIRTTSMVALCDQYHELEALYFDAYSKADDTFKDAALKPNKQQIEKETLSLVKEISKNQEVMKDSLQNLLIIVQALLSDEQKANVERLIKASMGGPKPSQMDVEVYKPRLTSVISVHVIQLLAIYMLPLLCNTGGCPSNSCS
jgi:hypothetical protein